MLRGTIVRGVLGLIWSVTALARADSDASPTSKEFPVQLERQTFALVNGYREKQGMLPLKWDDRITEVARSHSRDMATGDVDFGHGGFRARIEKLGNAIPGLRGAGENVLKTDDPDGAAQSAVTIWLHSPHHLENIRGAYNLSGLGVWLDKDGVIYFTQIFVNAQPVKIPAASAAVPPSASFGPFAQPITRGWH